MHNSWLMNANFYPRSPCGERRPIIEHDLNNTNISIHALLAESDKAGITVTGELKDFYPRSPCGERPQFNFVFGFYAI